MARRVFWLIYKESLKLALDVAYDEINLENGVITLCEKVISGGSTFKAPL